MWEKELEVAIKAAELARTEILKVYEQDFDIEIKEDNSPVTNADKNADKVIIDFIKERFPDHAFLTEESDDNQERLNNDYVWIVDPLDGTKDFVDKNGEFTTNIALSYKHKIVVGVVMIPVTHELYYATKLGGSFYAKDGMVEKINVTYRNKKLRVLTSRFHVNDNELALIKKHADVIEEVKTVGSSIKMCHIAHGKAEITYRLSNGTKEWDTAAGQIIVTEAGGVFLKPNLEKVFYNREDVYNKEGYIVANKKKNILL